MKSATVHTLKKELNERSQDDLVAFCLRLAKFKKENKELLTYLLFEESSESNYIENVKAEIGSQLKLLNTKNYYWLRKGIRKTLKEVKKYIRYSQNKETEVELLLDFCLQINSLTPKISKDKVLDTLLHRQLTVIRKKIEGLHEELQFDFNQELSKQGWL